MSHALVHVRASVAHFTIKPSHGPPKFEFQQLPLFSTLSLVDSVSRLVRAALYGRVSLYVAARPLQARLLALGSSPGSAALRPVVTRLPPRFGSSASGGVWGSPFALPRFGRSASGGGAGCKSVVARAFQRFWVLLRMCSFCTVLIRSGPFEVWLIRTQHIHTHTHTLHTYSICVTAYTFAVNERSHVCCRCVYVHTCALHES